MRVTNEKAEKVVCSNTMDCVDCFNFDGKLCCDMPKEEDLAADLLEARELIKEMRSKLLVGGIQATEDMTMFRSIPVDVEIIRDLIKRTKEYARMTTPEIALAFYGREKQIRKTLEELAELSVELHHALDGRADNDKIREEMADVEIMLEQLKLIYGPTDEWKKTKLERLEMRIHGAKLDR